MRERRRIEWVGWCVAALIASSAVGCDAVQGAIDDVAGDSSKSGKGKGEGKKKKKGKKKRGHRMPGKSGVVPAPDPGASIQPKKRQE